MDQQKLRKLLEEAAKPSCSRIRRNEVHCELADALLEGRSDEEEDQVEGMRVVLDHLFTGASMKRPELLPSLFPAFATLCGDRDERIIAEIDWSLVP